MCKNDKTIAICKKISALGKRVLMRIENNSNSAYKECMKYCFQRASDLFESIIILTINNKIIDSAALLRLLIENLCQMRYIALDPKERTELFIQYDTLMYESLRQQMLKSRRYESDKKEIVEELKLITEDVEKIRQKYPNPNLGWHQKNIFDLMKKVKLEDRYPLYWLLNHSIHSGPTTIKKYAENLSEYRTVYLEGSTDFYFMTLELVDMVFSLNIENDISTLHSELSSG